MFTVLLDDSRLARLAGSRFGCVVQLAEATSTNSVLSDEARRGAAEGLVVVADYQSAGRGRFERRWESPPGASLLFSVLLKPLPADLPAGRRHLAVAAVSLALAEGARAVTGVKLGLKWPNDLIAAGPGHVDRKVAGLLAETTPGPGQGVGIVVGAGLNVTWAPEGVTATCLEALAGRSVERGEVLVCSLLALDRLYGNWDLVAKRYRESCVTLGREVAVTVSRKPADLQGTALDVDEDGHLIVRTSAGALVRVAAGDVTHATVVGPH
jgi:BirA family biotin operon repressor/biotin-[acetyl-CoA-carboxylase] ligase